LNLFRVNPENERIFVKYGNNGVYEIKALGEKQWR